MQLFDDAEIQALGFTKAPFLENVRRALIAHHVGDLLCEGKRTCASSGTYASGTHGIWPERHLAFFHNLVGLDRNQAGSAGSTYRSIQTLFSLNDATPLLVVQGAAISSLVPVVVSCLAAEAFAPREAATVGFVGAGLQARLHLKALTERYPLKKIWINSRSAASAESFAAFASSLGVEASLATSPQAAIADADIVVSSISESMGIAAFLDAAWLKPGAFVTSVDMLRPWFKSRGHVPLNVVVDEMEQAVRMAASGRVGTAFPFNVGLGEVLSGAAARPDKDAVTLLMHQGCCATLLGMAAALLEYTAATLRPFQGAS